MSFNNLKKILFIADSDSDSVEFIKCLPNVYAALHGDKNLINSFVIEDLDQPVKNYLANYYSKEDSNAFLKTAAFAREKYLEFLTFHERVLYCSKQIHKKEDHANGGFVIFFVCEFITQPEVVKFLEAGYTVIYLQRSFDERLNYTSRMFNMDKEDATNFSREVDVNAMGDYIDLTIDISNRIESLMLLTKML